jgi:hypothetical protein
VLRAQRESTDDITEDIMLEPQSGSIERKHREEA